MDMKSLIERAGGVAKLAALCGVSHSTVCGWKRDGFLPASRLGQIAEALQFPIAELLSLVKVPERRAGVRGTETAERRSEAA